MTDNPSWYCVGSCSHLCSLKKIFLVSIVIFMLASVLCATAPTSAAFVTGRAVSGFACAGIMAGCFLLLVQALPLRKRPMYVGCLGAVEGLAIIIAPLLGGVITDRLGWRWCLWISVPSGAATLLFLVFFFQDINTPPEMPWRQKLAHLDLLGNAIFVPALTCLFIALGWAGSKYPWNSPTVIGLFGTFGVLLTVFSVWQYKLGEKAALPPRVLSNRSVMAGALFSACCNAAMNVVEYYLPTYFQSIREYDATRSGFLLFPMIGGFVIGMLTQGFTISASGYYYPSMIVASILMPVFSGLLTTIKIDSELARVLCYSGFYGFAGGIGLQGPQSAVQASLPDSDASIALSIITFSQSFGPAVFVSAAQSIFTNRLTANLQTLAPGLNATSIENLGLTDLKGQIGADKLSEVLAGLDKSLMQTWYLAIALGCITMVGSLSVEWKSVKEKKQ
jgi:predicted MFS family arabinose efflux permease